ncbi:putative HNT1-adenosine 5`-monophosphoramidase [Thamnocephalis sphaerospora]|uniref:Putative HNT1-adenosine 5`-monophosphoramidase n=1 Tax=Thamnocephalis sphaerospora TaxID=78915 RepID=A0A4P9XGE2_9FUNG|nr:putative HNT1-adenosine 5`-monophosphoramidase [Thamnocephalis sphaerospora]|eukprot:RKP04648.1 putative HNT1-adenosine 5`-monophosphoramidase [Thamnocephalis sphaerospora]
MSDCIFCKFAKGTDNIPIHKVYETDKTLAFLDISPLAEGHVLVIPKEHYQFFHEVDDASLADLLPVAKKVALAVGAENYNLLQNNGTLAHQVVPHVHFHIIPKPDEKRGLGIGWPAKQRSPEEQAETLKRILAKLS